MFIYTKRGGSSAASPFGVNLHLFLQCRIRNEFNFWNIHKIMNTSGLLQSNLLCNFARDAKFL